MKKQAFTLAEVLITLTIIGVVAAMTIPSVIVRTNQQEYETGAKKAFSALSTAIKLVEAQDGININEEYKMTDAELEHFIDLVKSKMNIIKTDTDGEGNTVFYTADGFRYHIETSDNFFVDVNGDKGPTNVNMAKSEWAKAKLNNDDKHNPDWSQVKLTDMFYIDYEPDGKSRVVPYAGICGWGYCDNDK